MSDIGGADEGIDDLGGEGRDDTAPATPAGDGPPSRDTWMVRSGIAVAVGLGAGLAMAVLAGVAGASGQAGAVLMLLALSLGTAIGALMALLSSVVEEFRGGDVGWRRPTFGTALFVAAAMLMAMTVAAAG